MLNLVSKYGKKRENLDMYRPNVTLRGRHKIKMKLLYSNKDRLLKGSYYMSVQSAGLGTQSNETWEEFKRKLKLIKY